MESGAFGGGNDGECNDIGLAEISKIVMMRVSVIWKQNLTVNNL